MTEERRSYNKQWRAENKDKIRANKQKYYLENKEKISQKAKQYRLANLAKIKAKRKAYYDKDPKAAGEKTTAWRKANRIYANEYKKKWCARNKDKILLYKSRQDLKHNNAVKNIWRRKQFSSNLNFKIAHGLRKRLWLAIVKNQKTGSAITHLGCTVLEFKAYLESRFQPGMTWDNWTFYGWHIDHIKPLASFDLSDVGQLSVACHYSNLQPLWWHENLSKHAKV